MNELYRVIDEANAKLKMLFRMQRKNILQKRKGIVLVVDDLPEQAEFLSTMIKSRCIFSSSVVSVPDVCTAQDTVNRIGSDGIKVAVVDLELSGTHGNSDGMAFVDWLETNCPEIPYVILTGREDGLDDIERDHPGVDILVKGHTELDDYADALGLPEDEEKSVVMIPKDASL